MDKSKSKQKKCSYGAHGIIILLVLLLVLAQAATLYFTIKPPATPVIQGLTKEQSKNMEENRAILKKVAELTEIDPSEQALIVTIKDLEALKNSNPLNDLVYKNAKNGDKVIGFADRMIIYNEDEHRIIYEGKSPVQIQQDQYLEKLKPILESVAKHTDINQSFVPRLLTVTDPESLQEQQPEIYEDAQAGDQVLVYNDRVIIYRPSTDEIIFDKAMQVAPQ
jgi:hypothetical protein